MENQLTNFIIDNITNNRNDILNQFGIIEKAHVKAHQRKTKSGKLVQVKEYEDKRQKKKKNIERLLKHGFKENHKALHSFLNDGLKSKTFKKIYNALGSKYPDKDRQALTVILGNRVMNTGFVSNDRNVIYNGKENDFVLRTVASKIKKSTIDKYKKIMFHKNDSNKDSALDKKVDKKLRLEELKNKLRKENKKLQAIINNNYYTSHEKAINKLKEKYKNDKTKLEILKDLANNTFAANLEKYEKNQEAKIISNEVDTIRQRILYKVNSENRKKEKINDNKIRDIDRKLKQFYLRIKNKNKI